MLLVDERIRDIEYKYLINNLGQNVEKLQLSDDVYEEIIVSYCLYRKCDYDNTIHINIYGGCGIFILCKQ